MLRIVELDQKTFESRGKVSGGAAAGEKAAMQISSNTMGPRREEAIFFLMPRSTLLGRLADQLRDLSGEVSSAPAAYMRIALLPASMEDWLPVSLARKLTDAFVRVVTHPLAVLRDALSRRKELAGFVYEPAAHTLEFVADALPVGAKRPARRSIFRPVLAVSGFMHAALLLYLGFMALFGQYLGFRVVNKAYRKLDTSKILKPIYYTPVTVKMEAVDEASTLEEAIEAERLRREREKLERERAERERKRREAEEAARIAAEEAKKKEEEEPPPAQFGEFNEAPIKDILKNVVEIYKSGKFDLAEMKFKVRLEFRIAKDGSIPKSSIKLIKSSGSQIVDENSVQILWQLGESHALMPLSNMSSNSIDLEVTDEIVRLTIVGFAPNVEDAKNKVFALNTFKSLAQIKQKGTDTAEVLSMLKITNNNNRIDADLTVSRAKATEMINARFPGGGPPQ